MTCVTCLRALRGATVCYVCEPDAVEKEIPHACRGLSLELGFEGASLVESMFAFPIWDVMTADEYELALAVKRGWCLPGLWPTFNRVVSARQQARVDADEKRRVKEARLRGVWLGTAGGRFDFPLLECVQALALGPGDYGERWMYRFLGPGGEAVVWFTGEGGKLVPEEGGTYSLTAFVKEHGEFNDERQTIIQRPKVRTEE